MFDKLLVPTLKQLQLTYYNRLSMIFALTMVVMI